MRYLFVCILFTVTLFPSCGEQAPDTNGPKAERPTYGLNSVVLLTKDTLEVVFSDYFKEDAIIDSIQLPKGLYSDWKPEAGEMMLYGKMESWIDAITVYIDGQKLVVPVKRPAMEKVQLTFASYQMHDSIDLVGNLNSWTRGVHRYRNENGVYRLDLELAPGGYAYRLIVDGEEMLDPANGHSVPNGFGAFNSFLKVEPSNAEMIPHLVAKDAVDKLIHVVTSVYGGKWFALWQNQAIEKAPDDNLFVIPDAAKEMERSYIRIWSETEEGLSNELRIPLKRGKVITSTDQLTRFDSERNIMYFMMVDRFVNGDTSIDEPVEDERILPRANYFGGDLEGVRQKLEEDYFDDLGINTLWISPITQNPTGAYQEYPEPRRWFSGYHGYWPISFKKVDHRLGSNAGLKTLVDQTHESNKNIILDYVCNHVHEEHPMIISHPEWKTDLDLPDGRRNLRLWDEQRLTTWFDDFLPTLDFSIPEVTDVMSDSALWWIEEFDFDGFRHDATKHIPESFWRANTIKLKKLGEERGRSYFQVGETFGSRELIQSYIGSGMMDGQFDFNLYFDAVSVLKDTNEPMSKLSESLQASLNYHGSLHAMCNITGNHDLTRFISLASKAVRDDEDQKEAGWKREINVEDPVGYAKLKMLQTFIMTIPGIPVIFYGDEIGMPGANDPDNRRMMRFENLKPAELDVKAHVSAITRLRAAHMALLFGDVEILQADDHVLAYGRSYLNDRVVTLFNNSDREVEVSVTATKDFEAYDVAIPHQFKGGKLIVRLPPFSSQILYANLDP
ncbi:MAG: alpha-amylase family glycosyl hydrolase [Cryomorphaceae bacterium]